MKRSFLPSVFTALLLARSAAFAQNPSNSISNADYMQLGWQEFPIASIDNLFIPYSNPSLLGTGNADGIGLVHLADKERFQKRYWLMLNAGNLAYSYDRDHGTNYHMLATGFDA